MPQFYEESKKLTLSVAAVESNQDTTRSAQQKPATKLETSSHARLQTVQITPNSRLTMKVPPFF